MPKIKIKIPPYVRLQLFLSTTIAAFFGIFLVKNSLVAIWLLVLPFFSYLAVVKPIISFWVFMLVSIGIGFIKTILPDIPLGLLRDSMMIVLVLVRILMQSWKLRIEDILVFLFFLWGMMGAFNPNIYDKVTGLNATRGFILPAILYYFSRSMSNKSEFPDILMKLLMIFGLLNMIFIVLAYFHPNVMRFYSDIYLEQGYAPQFGLFGASGWHNLGLLMAVVGVCLYFYRFNLNGAWYYLGMAEIICVIYTLVHTFARTPLVAGIAALLLTTIISRQGKKAVIGILAVGINLWILSLVVGPVLLEHYLTLKDPFQINSWQGRLIIWGNLWNIFKEHIWGLGPGATGGMSLTSPFSFAYGSQASDSIYFKVIVEHGIIGICLFLAICFFALLRARNIVLRSNNSLNINTSIFWACYGCFLLFLLSGISVTMLEMFPGNFIFWLLIGILVNFGLKNKPVKNFQKT
jgi:hypothetical protein